MTEPISEADMARAALEITRLLEEGEEATIKLATIEEIIDNVIACERPDPRAPWDALVAIRKVLR